MTAETGAPGGDWQRLSRRMLLINLKWLVPPAASALVYALFTGGELDKEAFIRLGIVATIFVLVLLAETFSVLTTRFRVTDGHFEMRKGLLMRQHKTIPRDRVRRVDLTAGPMQRLLGLTVVRIGTGQSHGEGSDDLKLNALSRQDGTDLRQRLLRRSTVAGDAGPGSGLIIELSWSWIRYSPLTVWGVLGIALIAAIAVRSLEIFGIEPEDIWRLTVRVLDGMTVWESILIPAGILLLLGVVGCLLAFVEEWWNYRLEQDDDAVRVQRGLVTTRSLSIDRRRVRGVEVAEPLLMRLGGAARVDVVATGMKGSDEEEHKNLEVLTPAVPRGEAHRVAGEIVGCRPSPTSAITLHPHPRAALRRRVVRAALGVILPLGALAVAGALWLPGLATAACVSAIVLMPVALVLAADAYRALGHGRSGRYLVTRYGTADRRTVALQSDGVIGWKIVRSPTQRLSGLATVEAVTAAGKHGSYKIRDVGYADGLRFADEAVPGLLAGFLRRPPVPSEREDAADERLAPADRVG